MALRAFFDICPNNAGQEMLKVEITSEPGLPKGSYTLVDSYCDDPACDCRYVALTVYHTPEQEDESVDPEVIALITYAWESPAFYAEWLGSYDESGQMMSGVNLDPIFENSSVAQAFRNYVEEQIYKYPEVAVPFLVRYKIIKSKAGALGARKSNRLVPIRRKPKKKRKR